jgi:hypothetical protein
VTPLSVVPKVEPYLAAFAEGSLLFARAHGTKPERVSLLAALVCRESWACTAPGYRPKGSVDGSGDWTARTGSWCRRPGVIVHPDTDGARAALRLAGWSIPHDLEGKPLPGPYAIPKDGKGWGRGMGQVDFLGDFADLIAPTPWPVAHQAAVWCAQLNRNRQELAEWAKHPLFERAVAARYNAALPRIVTGMENAITKKDDDLVDAGTTGHDYGRDVLALEAAVVARWPDTGIDLPAPPRTA